MTALDDLRRRWLYARALEAIGRTDEAVAEYKALAGYFPGAEARVRYGLLLDRKIEARMVLSDLLTYMWRPPKHVRKIQARVDRQGRAGDAGDFPCVMPGQTACSTNGVASLAYVPGIHAVHPERKSWMAGTSPAMTGKRGRRRSTI